MSVRTKDQLRTQWENGDIITQPVAYDLIDTIFTTVDQLSSNNSTYNTVNTLSANSVSVYSTVCSLSTQWDPVSSWGYMKTTVPASFSATGDMGNWSYDSTTFYLCVSASTWVKWNISNFW